MKGARRFVLLAAAGLVAGVVVVTLSAGGGGAAPPSRSAPTDAVAAASSTTSTVAAPSTTALVATTTAAPAPITRPRLPVPEPLPEDPYAEDPDEPIGRIAIPAIGLDSELGQGMTLTEIDRGPAHWPGTAMPGGLGNAVIAAHRSTRGAPFRYLDALLPGDEVRFSVGSADAVYLVTETFVVEPNDVWIANQGLGRTVTLFACHPVGSAALRIVVRGVLVPPLVPVTAT